MNETATALKISQGNVTVPCDGTWQSRSFMFNRKDHQRLLTHLLEVKTVTSVLKLENV